MYRTITIQSINLTVADVINGEIHVTSHTANNPFPSISEDSFELCRAMKKAYDIPNSHAIISVDYAEAVTRRYYMDDTKFLENSILSSLWTQPSTVRKVTYTFKTRLLTLHGFDDETEEKRTVDVIYSGDLNKISDKKSLRKMFDIDGFTAMRYEVKEEINEQRYMREDTFMKNADRIEDVPAEENENE